MSKKVKIAFFVTVDICIVIASWAVASVVVDMWLLTNWLLDRWYLLISAVCFLILANVFFGIYLRLWEFASLSDTLRLLIIALIMFGYNAILSISFNALKEKFVWAIIVSVLEAVLLMGSRFIFKARYLLLRLDRNKTKTGEVERVMIIGAGSAGSMLIKEIKRAEKLKMIPVCVLDDDENKVGRVIDGVKIVGVIDEVQKHVERHNIDKIIIAIPSAEPKFIAKVVERCKMTGCKVLILPGVYQLANESISLKSVKDVSIDDLLGREQVKVNLDEIMGYIEGKCVLVTGGGGSIGSELCRQIATHNPSQLIVVDIYENNAYDIEQELLKEIPNLNLLVLIASVRDSKKINSIFAKYKPQIVFHAAAHKHVPLMETSPNEAVKNNVSGTYKVATAAGRNGAEKFVLISTDKAVNPTNIMGATKRICEMIIQVLDKKYQTNFVAVRFGNVLGSNGSVIPMFKRQIEKGGPVTVTHKDIVRYFMTIPEAVSLVLQAGAYAKGGEIFVLDMGEPVRIYDLAENMIRLSGFEPHKDIEIKIIGLRPGEKLYEERLMEEEGMKSTDNKKISIGKPLDIDEDNLLKKIEELYVEAYNETDRMKELVHELVPTYTIDRR